MKNSPRSQLRESELQLNDLRPDTTSQNKILSPLLFQVQKQFQNKLQKKFFFRNSFLVFLCPKFNL